MLAELVKKEIPRERRVKVVGDLVTTLLRLGWSPPAPDAAATARIADSIARGGRPDERQGRATRSTLELSERELEVVTMISDGETMTEIAERLGLSRETVKEYATSARARLGARNVAHVVAIAIRRGIIL